MLFPQPPIPRICFFLLSLFDTVLLGPGPLALLSVPSPAWANCRKEQARCRSLRQAFLLSHFEFALSFPPIPNSSLLQLVVLIPPLYYMCYRGRAVPISPIPPIPRRTLVFLLTLVFAFPGSACVIWDRPASKRAPVQRSGPLLNLFRVYGAEYGVVISARSDGALKRSLLRASRLQLRTTTLQFPDQRRHHDSAAYNTEHFVTMPRASQLANVPTNAKDHARINLSLVCSST